MNKRESSKYHHLTPKTSKHIAKFFQYVIHKICTILQERGRKERKQKPGVYKACKVDLNLGLLETGPGFPCPHHLGVVLQGCSIINQDAQAL